MVRSEISSPWGDRNDEARGDSDVTAPSAVEQARAESRIAHLAAGRLAQEASEALRVHARFVERVRHTAQSMLTRVEGGADAPAQILRDVAQEIAVLRDLALSAECVFGAGGEGEFCRPDVILDRAVAAARERGVAIDYVRSFSDFTMFAAQATLATLMRLCIECAAAQGRGQAIRLRANFHDAHDGRRMLRLVIGAEAGSLPIPAADVERLASAARSASASVVVKDNTLIVMLRAPLAAPASLLSVQPDIEAHSS